MIEKIAVIGAGTMGHGMAEAFAVGGCQVNLFDVNQEQIDRGIKQIKQELALFVEEGVLSSAEGELALGRIRPFTDLSEVVKDRQFIVEATPELMELKQNLLAQLDSLCPEDTILGTNTSSLALAPMMERVSEARKKRVLVTHWYNPAHVMPLVELSFFGNMDAETYREVEELHQRIGKQTARVLKDIPGLVANRIQQGVAREVFSLIQQGIAEPKEIDKALKFGPAFRYATTGQLEVADFGGLDIWCAVGDNLLAVMDSSRESNPILREKAVNGKLGLKTGEGFFVYDPQQIDDIRTRFVKKLIHQLKASSYYAE